MKYFLIAFRAEYYCQGYEWGDFTVLVQAETFEAAIVKIQCTKEIGRFSVINHKDFENLTIL